MTQVKVAFKRMGLMAKRDALGANLPLMMELADCLKSLGCVVLIESTSLPSGYVCTYPTLSQAALGQQVDCVIAIGGDGMMLLAARALLGSCVPLMGINQGRFGFMTDIAPANMIQAVKAVLAGNFIREKRHLIAASVLREGEVIHEAVALNDLVLRRGSQSQMIEFEVFIDQTFVYRQRSDGLIVTTPTGSTAYALSAGGPILHPQLAALSLVPISPHSMNYRPIVIHDNAQITLSLIGGVDACVHFDGQSCFDLVPYDQVAIHRNLYPLSFIHPPGYCYFEALRGKLHWGQQLTVDPSIPPCSKP